MPPSLPLLSLPYARKLRQFSQSICADVTVSCFAVVADIPGSRTAQLVPSALSALVREQVLHQGVVEDFSVGRASADNTRTR